MGKPNGTTTRTTIQDSLTPGSTGATQVTTATPVTDLAVTRRTVPATPTPDTVALATKPARMATTPPPMAARYKTTILGALVGSLRRAVELPYRRSV